MTDNHLTISEAEKLTGKSRSTLRRFVEGITKNDASPDRHFLLPPVDEFLTLRELNQPFSWKISRELLDREFPAETVSETASHKNDATADDRIVLILEKTVGVLEEELNQKNRQIAEFQERQKEHNVLIHQLQKQVAIAAPVGESATTGEVADADVLIHSHGKASSTNNDPTPEPLKSRIPFAWVFGR